jgi:hypothetical protein
MKGAENMKDDCLEESHQEDRLPMFYRTMKLPNGLWNTVKECGGEEGKALRWIVDEALDAELLPLVESLREFGLKGEIKADKLARVPLDDNAIGRLNHARRQTGLSAVLLLRMCLRRYVAETRDSKADKV